MGFLDDSLNKHLRQVQGPTPEELALREEVAKLTSALRQTATDLRHTQKLLRDEQDLARQRGPVDPKTIFGRLIELSESRNGFDQTVTISMRMDTRLMAPTERHEREMIAREVASYVEGEILRCRLTDIGRPNRSQVERNFTMEPRGMKKMTQDDFMSPPNPAFITPDHVAHVFWSKDEE